MNQRAIASPDRVLSTTSAVLQRKCLGSCRSQVDDKKNTLQRKASSNHEVSEVPPIVYDVLRSSGQPLDAATRGFFEPRFGHDFSRVKVHVNRLAAESARCVNARAYTLGSNIAFDSGEYSPSTSKGIRLLAHELSHVMQQRNANITSASAVAIGSTTSQLESQADDMASSVMTGSDTPKAAPTPAALVLQRSTSQFSDSSSEEEQSHEPINAPSNDCRIEVRATHISGPLSIAPIWHLFVVLTDSSGKEFLYRGGPGLSCGSNQTGHKAIKGTSEPYQPGSTDWDTEAPRVAIARGRDACGKHECLKNQLNRIEASCTEYSPFGPNSNTTARVIVEECGLSFQSPVSITPGVDDELFPRHDSPHSNETEIKDAGIPGGI
jgi:hypothetical protein